MKVIDWKTAKVKVTNVDLDPKNVRLDTEESPTQDSIIRDLFNNENAIQIVESIAQNGFFNQELPIVTEENGRLVVLEGNRRFAAIKAILNPSLVAQREARLKELIGRMGNVDALKEIEVKVATSREDASKVIASIHTQKTRRSWSPLRQAHFYYAQISEGGKSIGDLQKEYPNVDIPEFAKKWEVHNLAKSVDYQNEETQKNVASKKFPISTMERLYNNPKFLGVAKWEFDKNGQLTVHAADSDTEKIMRKVVNDIYGGKIDTRVLNKNESDSYKAYMMELQNLEIKKHSKSKKASEATPVAIPEVAKGSNALVPKDVKCTIGYPAVERVLIELKGLNYRRYPNAAHDLLRSFLECSLKAYFDKVGEAVPKKNKYVYLDDVLKHAKTHFQTVKPAYVQSINKLLDKNLQNEYAYSSDFLNAINHNYAIFSTPKEVKDAWDNIAPMIEYVLNPLK